MSEEYTEYRETSERTIQKTVSEYGCQPILFIGSGLSRRYFGAPNWDELLSAMARRCPQVSQKYGYYKQKFHSLPEVGTEFAGHFRDWAWSSKGSRHFPKELLDDQQPSEIYLKYSVSEYIDHQTPMRPTRIRDRQSKAEISAIQKIQAHSLITTNYDQLLERILPDYTPIIGQQVIRANYVSVGEIFKIHGCVTDPETLVLTSEDYEDWRKKKKYLSAKLLTYFAEHPLLFIGYAGNDENIRDILSDIDEILAEPSGLVKNIFFLNYVTQVESHEDWQRERLIELAGGRSIRVRNIDAEDFLWVFEAFATSSPIEKVNPKLLRALLARNYELVRHDIPRKTVEINFETLEHAVKEEGQFAQLLGISTLNNPQVFNVHYPYTLSAVAKQLGYSYWSHANKLLKQIEEETGLDIKSFDNAYHITVKTGPSQSSFTKKYSQACVDLLKLVRDEKRYEIDQTAFPQIASDTSTS